MSNDGGLIKKGLVLVACFLAGVLATILVGRTGCTLAGGSSFDKWSLSCNTAPCEGTKVKARLSGRSRMSLRSALENLQTQTASRPGNEVYVDPEVLDADFSRTEVALPNDYVPSVTLARTLLQEARAQKEIDVCLEPEGGFRLKLACRHP